MRSHFALLSLVVLSCGGQVAEVPSPAAPVPAGAPAKTKDQTPKEIVQADDEGIDNLNGFARPMPTALTSFGAATTQGQHYVAGGYHGEAHNYSREGQTADLWRVGTDADARWEKVGQLPIALQGLSLVALDDRVCTIGGNHIENAKGEQTAMRSVATALCFNVENRSWSELPPMPKGRSSHEAAVIDGVIYVAGGWSLGGADGGPASTGEFATDVLRLDTKSNPHHWESVAAPFKRRAVGVAAVKGKLIVVGGLSDGREVSGDTDVFDPKTGAWSKGPAFPSDAMGVAARGVDDDVFASARDGIVYRWSPKQTEWAPVTSLAFPRMFHQILADQRGLLVVGGITGMQTHGRTKHVERVSVSETKTVVQSFTMPNPTDAKNRQGVFLKGDMLYLFGGNNSLGQHDFAPENFLSQAYRLHLPSLTWQKLPDYPQHRQTMQTATTDKYGIAIGGFGHNGETAVSFSESYLFDFAAETWAPMADLPRGRTQFGLTAKDDTLWIFGGLNYDPSRKADAAFDHVTNTLIAKAPGPKAAFQDAKINLPGPRRAFGGATLGDAYYIVGGMKAGFELVDGCKRFDFESKRFSAFPCPSANRLSADLIPLDGRLYIVGGSVRRDGKMTPERSVEVYDPKCGRWSTIVDDIGFDPKHAHVMPYGERILIFSTHQEQKVALMALIDPSRDARLQTCEK